MSAALTAALWISVSAQAHDTWFEVLGRSRHGTATVALGTGARFPTHETAIDDAFLRRTGCLEGETRAGTWRNAHLTPTARVARAPAMRTDRMSCWAQLTPLDIELGADKVAVYLDEIRATPEVRQRWQEQRWRGLEWKERYTKHARIELAGTDRSGERGTSPGRPIEALDMDVVLDAAAWPVRPGEAISFQVLRDGHPLPDFALELRSSQTGLGFWRRTDAQGRVLFAPPLPGSWLLRGTDLRPSDHDAHGWESHFVTLVFEVAQPARPAPSRRDQNLINSRSNSRSTSQTAARTAISADPAVNTTR